MTKQISELNFYVEPTGPEQASMASEPYAEPAQAAEPATNRRVYVSVDSFSACSTSSASHCMFDVVFNVCVYEESGESKVSKIVKRIAVDPQKLASEIEEQNFKPVTVVESKNTKETVSRARRLAGLE